MSYMYIIDISNKYVYNRDIKLFKTSIDFEALEILAPYGAKSVFKFGSDTATLMRKTEHID